MPRVNTFPCRCKNCQGRKSLAKHPLEYRDGRCPPCPHCGHSVTKQRKKYGDNLPHWLMGQNLVWTLDAYRLTKEHEHRKGTICYSDCMVPKYGRPFPHSKHSPSCRENENFKLELECGF